MSLPPPGWYPDPQDASAQRWWDGQRWTSDVRPSATAGQPLGPTEPEVTSQGGALHPGPQPAGSVGGRRGPWLLGGVLVAAVAVLAGVAGWLGSGAGVDGQRSASDPPGQPVTEDDDAQEQPGASEGNGPDEWATDLARRLTTGAAELSFRRVLTEIPPGTPRYDEGPDCRLPVAEHDQPPRDGFGIVCGSAAGGVPDAGPDEELPSKYEVGPAELTGNNVQAAFAEVAQAPARGSHVVVELDEVGTDIFAEVTSDLACERDQGLDGRFAIVIDGAAVSVPGVNPSVECGVGITGGTATITGPSR